MICRCFVAGRLHGSLIIIGIKTTLTSDRLLWSPWQLESQSQSVCESVRQSVWKIICINSKCYNE